MLPVNFDRCSRIPYDWRLLAESVTPSWRGPLLISLLILQEAQKIFLCFPKVKKYVAGRWLALNNFKAARLTHHPRFHGPLHWMAWISDSSAPAQRHLHSCRIVGYMEVCHWNKHLKTSNMVQFPTLDVGYWHQRADERHGNPPPR